MTPDEIALSLDDTIRAEGQPMGRFKFVYRTSCGLGALYDDWLPDPDGTHDGFIWRLGFYVLPHQEDQP